MAIDSLTLEEFENLEKRLINNENENKPIVDNSNSNSNSNLNSNSNSNSNLQSKENLDSVLNNEKEGNSNENLATINSTSSFEDPLKVHSLFFSLSSIADEVNFHFFHFFFLLVFLKN